MSYYIKHSGTRQKWGEAVLEISLCLWGTLWFITELMLYLNQLLTGVKTFKSC